MAQKIKKTEVSNETSSNTQKTANEIRVWYEKNKSNLERYASAEQALKKLRDTKKNSTKVVSAFSKESLRNYLKNIGSNEKNLRNLSRYLFYRCHSYYRWIMYNSTMFDLKCRSVIPKYSLLEENDKEAFLNSYYSTLSVLDEMNLQFEFLKGLTIAFREDVFFGCAYYTEGEGMFILPLDPDYCKISGIYADGSFGFSMDVTYFRSRQFELEAWGSPFVEMYRAYESSGEKFQPMPDEYSVCLKSRPEDWETVLPIASGLLNSIINLIDTEDVQAIADAQEIYKMIWLEMETLSNADSTDEWKVNPDIMIEYFNRIVEEALPDYITAAIVPGKLNSINFDSSKVNDTNKVTKATETLFNSAGGAQILNSASITGTTAFNAAIQADTELAISNLLPQIEGIVNRLLSFYVNGDPSKVKFFEVSIYTKEAFKKALLEGATYGTPTILAYNSCNQFSELDTLALNFLERDCLGLHEKFIPVQSSHTATSNPGGGQEKDSDELTDDGESSRDKRDKTKG